MYRTSIFLFLIIFFANSFAFAETVLHVLQWEGYIPKHKADEFSEMIKKEMGEVVKFQLENIVDEKMLFDRTRSQKNHADLIFPGVDIIEDEMYSFKKRNLVMPLDPKKLKNFDSLTEIFKKPKHLMYKDKLYGISFAGGQVGIAYNTAKVNPRTIYDLLEAKYTGKLGSLDFSPHVNYVLALALGYQANEMTDYSKLSTNEDYLALLKKWGKMATVYFKDGVDNSAQAKDLVAYLGWGFALGKLRSEYNQEWKMMPLPGGTLVWVDSMMVPIQVAKDLKKVEVIYKLIDFLISEKYQKEVVLGDISCVPMNKHVLENLEPTDKNGLNHIFEFYKKKDIIFLPPLPDRRTRNGFKRMWIEAK